MQRPSRAIFAGLLVISVVAATLMHWRWLRPLDLAILDAQQGWLRKIAAQPIAADVVVIGIDEAAYESIAEPYALWHRHLGLLFTGLADAQAAAVGLALPLPVRSYDFIIDGADAALLSGLHRLKAHTPLVVGRAPGIEQRLRPLAPAIVEAVGTERIASMALCEDSDGRVRRLDSKRCPASEGLPPFSLAMANQFGRDAASLGLIDYSLGGEIDYLPIRQVLAWVEQGRVDELQSRLRGRPVVVASLLPNESRLQLPVALAAWERGRLTQHAAVAHVQGLRSLLGRGLIERVPRELSALFAVACALLWLGRPGWRKTLLSGLILLAVLAGSTLALWHGHYLPTGSLLAALLLALSARSAYESVRHYHEKELLRLAFAGHVSPQVMRAILGGSLQPDIDGQRCEVTLLFADIRGFTERSAKASPEAMIELLNRFHSAATTAILRHGGAVDKLVGDGLIATFGVPQPLDCPPRNALEAAQDLLVQIHQLNAKLATTGQAPLQVGIGIHCGEVLAGYVGSRKRRDFTVIGEAVNSAGQLEALGRRLGYPIACSHAVAAAVGFDGGMVDAGKQALPGQPPLHVWGWQPPLLARLQTVGGAP